MLQAASPILRRVLLHFRKLWEASAEDPTAWKLEFKQRFSDELAWVEKFLVQFVFTLAAGHANVESGVAGNCDMFELQHPPIPQPTFSDGVAQWHCWLASAPRKTDRHVQLLAQHHGCELAFGGAYIDSDATLTSLTAAFLWDTSAQFRKLSVDQIKSSSSIPFELLLHHIKSTALGVAVRSSPARNNNMANANCHNSLCVRALILPG